MNPQIINIDGWLPAIIFSAATLIQLLAIVKSRSTRGISWFSWTLFGVANISVYIFTEKYLAAQTIIGFLARRFWISSSRHWQSEELQGRSPGRAPKQFRHRTIPTVSMWRRSTSVRR